VRPLALRVALNLLRYLLGVLGRGGRCFRWENSLYLSACLLLSACALLYEWRRMDLFSFLSCSCCARRGKWWDRCHAHLRGARNAAAASAVPPAHATPLLPADAYLFSA